MDEIEIPPFFLCPISLQIMKDPVTISTGITYDRENIEKWIFTEKHNTCPATKQLLSATDITPNHTLRRLIQSWCTLNASKGIERFPTPKPPITKPQILKLLNDAKSPHLQIKSLKRLKSIASISETNKRCIEASGAAEFLASLINSNTKTSASLEELQEEEACDEALNILYLLQISEPGLKSLAGENGEFIESLMHIMQRGNYHSRAYSVLLLESMFKVVDPILLISLKPEFFIELVQILQDQISCKASRATLQVLIDACSWGRNRVKAVEAGLVKLLIDLLVDSLEKRFCEMILMVLEQMCQSAEGRSEFLKHRAGLAVVSKKILRVSKVGSERGVRILFSISKHSATPSVVQEMLEVGAVNKLFLVLQVESGSKTKEKAREILKLHAKAWKNSSCMPMTMISSYSS